MLIFNTSLVPRPRPSCILKAIRAGVGFGSGTETNLTQDSHLSELVGIKKYFIDCIWQSCIEIEGYSIGYFHHIAAFQVPYC